MKDINFDRFVWVLIEGEATRPMGNARMVKDGMDTVYHRTGRIRTDTSRYICKAARKQCGRDGKKQSTTRVLGKGVSYRQYPQVIRTILKNY